MMQYLVLVKLKQNELLFHDIDWFNTPINTSKLINLLHHTYLIDLQHNKFGINIDTKENNKLVIEIILAK